MIRVSTSLAAALFAAGAFAPPASAAPLTFYDDAALETGAQFTLDCAGCEALIAEFGVYDPVKGQMFTVSPPNDANEAAFVSANTLPLETFVGADKTDMGGVESVTFSSMAAYILFKIGGGQDMSVALIRNISGGEIDITFTKLAGSNGLSHINEFGTSTAVPLPAAGWLLLTGLAGLGFAAKRRRAA
ncbi:MAG: VPLPA-CTERM sorting domain-containing protein [Pikeienuella sp.]|uniref:VPLPA-CTERM sorting domain-containing protein n=1 Tax=Pikeienuella sp. TaxID=2831957 RepID=UPI00391C158D